MDMTSCIAVYLSSSQSRESRKIRSKNIFQSCSQSGEKKGRGKIPLGK